MQIKKLKASFGPENTTLNGMVMYGVLIYTLSPYVDNPSLKNTEVSKSLHIFEVQMPNSLKYLSDVQCQYLEIYIFGHRFLAFSYQNISLLHRRFVFLNWPLPIRIL